MFQIPLSWKGKTSQHEVISHSGRKIPDTQIKLGTLCRLWKITNLISTRVPAVTGSDLLPYYLSTRSLQEQRSCVGEYTSSSISTAWLRRVNNLPGDAFVSLCVSGLQMSGLNGCKACEGWYSKALSCA